MSPAPTRPADKLVPYWFALDQLGVSLSTLNRMRADGRLPFVRVGHRVFFRQSDLDRIVAEGCPPKALAVTPPDVP